MGDNNTGGSGGNGGPIIPLATPIPPKNNSVIPVAIAAFVEALVGAAVGTQLG